MVHFPLSTPDTRGGALVVWFDYVGVWFDYYVLLSHGNYSFSPNHK